MSDGRSEWGRRAWALELVPIRFHTNLVVANCAIVRAVRAKPHCFPERVLEILWPSAHEMRVVWQRTQSRALL